MNGQVIILSKNGYLYDMNESTGAVAWSTQADPIDGYAIESAASDGNTIVVSGGQLSAAAPYGGALLGYNFSGKQLWSVQSQLPIDATPAIVNGVAIVPVDESLDAIDLTNGTVLWSQPMSTSAYSSAAIVPSGVYETDGDGDVYAYGLTSSSTSARKRR